ncbi:hypothetical protein F751_4483 [Auxenochlorella protothecoides]|uniref:Uncharacterized protein n=1 Tax=Auxenochlorella protothecoides TaxID=3075 RepID=A0A087SNA9_AUXPR|nr:hypothetical protein F751_4483 [Auxenochlorella protothecoides]KFM27213.1 hypothetical protein F751_4483 [Auxenochlorella protothecoides]
MHPRSRRTGPADSWQSHVPHRLPHHLPPVMRVLKSRSAILGALVRMMTSKEEEGRLPTRLFTVVRSACCTASGAQASKAATSSMDTLWAYCSSGQSVADCGGGCGERWGDVECCPLTRAWHRPGDLYHPTHHATQQRLHSPIARHVPPFDPRARDEHAPSRSRWAGAPRGLRGSMMHAPSGASLVEACARAPT